MCKRLALVAFCFSTIISYAQNVGIGTTTPGSGLELKGPGLGAQQRITDPASGNSLVLQGGPGESLKVTGYNYGTGSAKPLYLSVDGASTIINPNGGNVGIGTAAPCIDKDPCTGLTPCQDFLHTIPILQRTLHTRRTFETSGGFHFHFAGLTGNDDQVWLHAGKDLPFQP